MQAGTEKGTVLSAAATAGLMGVKKTADLIPMCHILPLRNSPEITHHFDFPKCSATASENLDVARYACDFLLCS